MTHRNLPWFVTRYRESIASLITQVFKGNPSAVIAITRKGPRLLDLARRFGIGSDLSEEIVFSERAIDFIPVDMLKGRLVNVVDDIVIYGTTMKRVCNSVRETGASVLPFTLAINKDSICNDLCVPEFVISLHPSDVFSFNNNIVKAFRYLPKPYDVDHPLLYLQPGDAIYSPRSELEDTIRSLDGNAIFLNSFDEEDAGLMNFSFIPNYSLELSSILADSSLVRSVGLWKARIFVDFRAGNLTMAPVFIFNAKTKNMIAGEKFFVDELDSFNSIMESALEILRDNDIPQERQEQCAYRLMFYLVELLYGTTLMRAYKDVIFDSSDTKLDQCIDPSDIRILFGPVLANSIINSIRKFENSIEDTVRESFGTFISWKKQPIVEKIKDFPSGMRAINIWNKIKQGVTSEISPQKDLFTNFNTIFKQMYLHIEKDQRRVGNIDPTRLLYGFEYYEISNILQHFGCEFNNHHLSACLDYAVDRGAVVPVFLRDGDECIRAYRFGENVWGPEELKFAASLYTEHLANKLAGGIDHPIPKFDFEKCFIIVKNSLERAISPEWRQLKLGLKFDRFGARLTINESLEYLFPNWCIQNQIVKEASDGYICNLASRKLYPLSECPLERSTQADIKGIISLLSDLRRSNTYDEWKKNLLAFTTCNNEEAFISSLFGELDLWFGHEKFNFKSFLGSLINHEDKISASLNSIPNGSYVNEAGDEFSKVCVKEINEILYTVAGYFAETKLKGEVWANLSYLNKKLENLYLHMQEKEGHSYAFEKFLYGVLDPTNHTRNIDLKTRLQVIISMAKCLTSFSRTFLSENKVIKDTRDLSDVKSLSDYVTEYNNLVDKANHNPGLFFGVRLDCSKYLSGSFSQNVASFTTDVRKAYSELEVAFKLQLPEEPQIENMEEDRTVLYYDQIGSSEIADKLKRAKIASMIYSKLEQHTHMIKDGELNPTGNDSNTVLFKFEENAIRTAIYIAEEMLKQGYQLRIGVSSTKLSQRLHIDVRRKKIVSGSVFEVANRIAHIYDNKHENKELPGYSYIFMSQEIAEIFEGSALSKKCSIERVGEKKLKGKALPRVQISLILIQTSNHGKDTSGFSQV